MGDVLSGLADNSGGAGAVLNVKASVQWKGYVSKFHQSRRKCSQGVWTIGGVFSEGNTERELEVSAFVESNLPFQWFDENNLFNHRKTSLIVF